VAEATTGTTTEPRSTLRAELVTYRHMVAVRVRADWQYRTSFLLLFAGQALVTGADLIAILVLFSSIDGLAGWTAGQVVLLYGLTGVSFALADLVISPVETVSTHVKGGSFDSFLLRPAGALWQLLAAEFAARRLGRVVQPTVALAAVLPGLGIAWTPATVALVPVTIVAGFVLYGAFWVMAASICFWTVDSSELGNSLTYGGNALTNYPIDVLGRWLRRLATFVVPLASIAYLPACLLLGKPMPFGLPDAAGWSGPFVAVAWAVLARAVWRLAVRHYRSTGS
jgi:ABC-2 type transport system permease protein